MSIVVIALDLILILNQDISNENNRIISPLCRTQDMTGVAFLYQQLLYPRP
jgi:hypothetical protein